MSHTTNTASEKADYHGHPNYYLIWGILVAILCISLGIGAMGNSTLAVAIIFALAIVKALLVLGQFMHLKWEPRLIWGVIAFGVVCLFIFYFGVLPDIINAKQVPLN